MREGRGRGKRSFLLTTLCSLLLVIQGFGLTLEEGLARKGRENWSYQERLQVCFQEAGSYYGVSPLLLWGIAKVESNFNPYAVNRNRDGSYDLGLMQINSRWFKELKRLGFIGSERELYDPCKAVWAGAYILARCVSDYGYTWEAVGCYHSRSVKRNRWYARKVYEKIKPYLMRGERVEGREKVWN